MFTLAVHDRILATSPIDHLKGKPPAKPIRETPTFEEFQAIVASIREQVYNAAARDSGDFVELLGLAGLGQAEASSLTWGDVDWQNGRVRIFRHKTSTGFLIPLYDQLRPLLERIRQDRGGNPPVNENILKVKDTKNALGAACLRLKLYPYSHRAFRRMFVTRALERGVDPKAIAAWQGHADGGRLIMTTYSHLRTVHSDAMAKLMV